MEDVVALHAVDGDLLDVDVPHHAAGAVDAVRRDHEGVVELGPDDNHEVVAGAAVDVDRRVRGVLDEVAALAGVERGELGLTHEGADHEGVVTGVAVEVQRGDVAEHLEHVVARSAVDGGGEGHAARECAASGEEETGGRELGVGGVRRVELAEAEDIIAGIAVHRHDRGCVVEREGVVSPTPVQHDAAGDLGAVCDLLDSAELARRGARLGQQSDQGAGGVPAEEERVTGRRPVHHEDVRAAVGDVEGVDPAVAHAEQVDEEVVGVRAAVEVQHLAGHRVGADRAGHGVDHEEVVAGLALDGRGAGDGFDEHPVVTALGVHRRGGGVGGVDVQDVVAGAQREVEGLYEGVVDAAVGHG